MWGRSEGGGVHGEGGGVRVERGVGTGGEVEPWCIPVLNPTCASSPLPRRESH